MKYLSLLRHAQAQNDFTSDDKIRPLSKRGENDAAMLGQKLAAENHAPDIILCSTAVRTKQTLNLIQNAWEDKSPVIEYVDLIYLAPMGTLIDLVQKTSDDKKHILIVGHNPSMQMFSSWLFQDNPNQKEHENPFIYGYAPATYARFCFEKLSCWQDLQPRSGILDFYTKGS